MARSAAHNAETEMPGWRSIPLSHDQPLASTATWRPSRRPPCQFRSTRSLGGGFGRTLSLVTSCASSTALIPSRSASVRLRSARKGAVRAGVGEFGIIPGSMGAKSFIVRGKGNPQSFHSCSHGAGRAMSRKEAVRRFTIEDHARATAARRVPQGCRRDRRDADGLQGHRCGDGGSRRPRRGGAHAEAGSVRQGVTKDGLWC